MARTNPYSPNCIDPGADLTPEDVAFGRAVDAFRRATGRKFLSNGEYLAVLKSLGYRQVAEAESLPACRGPGHKHAAPTAFRTNPRGGRGRQ